MILEPVGLLVELQTAQAKVARLTREVEELVTRSMALVDERSALELAVHDLRRERDAAQAEANLAWTRLNVTESERDVLRRLVQEWEPHVACPDCGKRYTDTACGYAHAERQKELEG